MNLPLDTCRIREWRMDDLPTLVKYANNQRIAINLRDRFPHPYTEAAGRRWLEHLAGERPLTAWAIEVGHEAAGSIGVQLHSDVERVSAEIGYWLGEPFWGKGIVTDALRAVTDRAFDQFSLTRIYALPFADNAPSIRVLEKAGYVLEGRMPRSAIKQGVVKDQLMYGAYR